MGGFIEEENAAVLGITETKRHFSRVTRWAIETGRSVVVMKQNTPWVKIVPLAQNGGEDDKAQRT